MPSWSRRALLRHTVAAGAATAMAAPAAYAAARAGANPGAGNDPAPDADAAGALLRAFDRVPVVALGEAHGLLEEHAVIDAVLRHPDFPTKANDVVVEFGNARYQDRVDRYLVAGEDVPMTELRQIWRDTTVSPLQQWDSPLYERFFATVREVNRALPEARRVRVLLGDPPIDWSAVERGEDVKRFLDQREPHFASVVLDEVLARGRRALLLAGSFHVLRPGPGAGVGLNVVGQIERQHHGSTFVVVPSIGFAPTMPAEQACALEGRLASWPAPSLAPIADTWYGSLDAGLVFGGVSVFIGPDGKPVDPFAGSKVGDLADAILYLGPHDALTLAVESPFVYRDDSYVQELKRRQLIASGHPLDESSPRYYRYGIAGPSPIASPTSDPAGSPLPPGGPAGGPGAPAAGTSTP